MTARVFETLIYVPFGTLNVGEVSVNHVKCVECGKLIENPNNRTWKTGIVVRMNDEVLRGIYTDGELTYFVGETGTKKLERSLVNDENEEYYHPECHAFWFDD